MVRELHVYGQHTNVGSSNSSSVQHKGLGTRLLKKAEDIAKEHTFSKIAVISGVGVRDYYRKKGYTLGEHEYMFKEISTYTSKMYIICILIIVSLYLIYMEFK